MIPHALTKRRNQICLLVLSVCSLYWISRLRFPTSATLVESSDGSRATWPLLHSSSVMLVTAYFPDILTYPDAAISHTLQVTAPMYIFTTPSSLSHIQRIRGHRPTRYDMSLPSPTNISELALSIKKFDEQLSLDRDGDPDVYVPEIYALETSKVWLLNQALIREERKPGFVFWIDLDAFGNEDHPLVEWPDMKRLKEIWKDNGDERLLLSLVGLPHSTVRYWSDSLGTISTKFLSGTILGGPTSIIPDFTSRFYRAHDTLLRMRAFVGSTEAVLSALALSLPHTFATLPMPPDTPLPFENAAPILPRGCGPRPWTYLLASDSERILLRDKEWWKAWLSRKGWWGWKECSIGADEGASGVISLRDALQGLFGKWDGNKAHWD